MKVDGNMNPELIASTKILEIPQINMVNVRKSASEGVFQNYEKSFIAHALKTFFNAEDLYYDDYDPAKIYYTVRFDTRKIDICFDLNNIYHLLGLPPMSNTSDFCDINYCLNKKSNIKFKKLRRESLKFYTCLFHNCEDLLIEYDSNSVNEFDKKLNWDKISLKAFSFLNLGILSDGITYIQRNKTKNYHPDTLQEYIFVRKPLSSNCSENNSIRMTLIEHSENGKKFLVPKSLQFGSNLGVKNCEKNYKYIGTAYIEKNERSINR